MRKAPLRVSRHVGKLEKILEEIEEIPLYPSSDEEDREKQTKDQFMRAILERQAEYAGAMLEEGGNEYKAVKRINKQKTVNPVEEHAMTKYCETDTIVREMYQETLLAVKKELMESYLYKRRKLRQIMEICIPDDVKDFSQLDPDTCIKAFATGIKAADISNKMEGHYPKESSTLNEQETQNQLDRVRRLSDKYSGRFDSEY